ncbi:hypothetical protein HYW82_04210 [Candidatus Peregrinibacteria bacterium]|nr:hypothetical protein [Candidatus Peregrinibacteria bacterium]
MSHHKYIAIVGIAGVLAWVGWVLVISKLSPYESSGLALLLFFLTLFIALTSTFSVFGFYFRMWLFRNEIFYKHINVSVRQGLFLSLIVNFSLVFQMMKVLTWWSGLLLVVIALLLEFYFSSRDAESSGYSAW